MLCERSIEQNIKVCVYRSSRVLVVLGNGGKAILRYLLDRLHHIAHIGQRFLHFHSVFIRPETGKGVCFRFGANSLSIE